MYNILNHKWKKKIKKHEKSIRIVIKTSIYDKSLFTFRKEWVGSFVMVYTIESWQYARKKNVYIYRKKGYCMKMLRKAECFFLIFPSVMQLHHMVQNHRSDHLDCLYIMVSGWIHVNTVKRLTYFRAILHCVYWVGKVHFYPLWLFL